MFSVCAACTRCSDRNIAGARDVFQHRFGFVKDHGGSSWIDLLELLRRETASFDWRRSDLFSFCSALPAPADFRVVLANRKTDRVTEHKNLIRFAAAVCGSLFRV